MNRRTLLIAVVILALIGLPVLWWLASPLFVDRAVDEAFPFDVPSSAEIEAMSPAEAEATATALMAEIDQSMGVDLSLEMPAEQLATLEERMMAMAAKMPERPMDEEMPAAEWVAVAQGSFRDADNFHRGSGQATIYAQAGQRVLRLEDFSVTNGPALHVLLVENIDGKSSSELGQMYDIGALKGNVGNQNYELPTDFDLSQYSGVMIYCMPFHVVFATAPFQQ